MSVLVACMMVAMLGMAGFTVDTGRALYTYRQLQAATDAAALAGAYELPLSDSAAVATQYSAVSGDLNARTSLPGVTMVSGYPKILCLNTLKNVGMACASPANGNAIQVKEQITLPLIFLKLVGKSSLTIEAEATASMTGATRSPYNVAIIVDGTPSMNTTDSNCGATRFTCALTGVQVLLQNLSPCSANLATCGAITNGNAANPVDEVALYSFPGLSSSSQAVYDYDCNSSSKPTGSAYTEPNSLPAYQVVNFSSDYKTSNSATSLNPASNLVKAVGGASGCPGMGATISYNTYFAGVIYAAAQDLYYEQQARPGSQNVIILLGDGDANAPQSNMPNASTTSGVYASTKKECQQAITNAQTAYNTYGMRFYAISYGAAATGCSTDSGALTPCQTMTGMASARNTSTPTPPRPAVPARASRQRIPP